MKTKFISPKVFLEDEWKRRNKRNPRYSLRAFAKLLGVHSGRLSEYLSGKRKISVQTAEKLSTKMGLSPTEKSKFLTAIRIDLGATNIPPTSLQKSVESYTYLNEDIFHVIADWYHFAILSLMNTADFKFDVPWIARRLGLSPIEVRHALDRLFRIGLIEQHDNTIVRTRQNLATSSDIESSALRHSHKQSLEKAINALEDVPMEKRDVSSITMAIDSSKIPLAKELIKNFRRQLCALLETDQRDEVYEMNIQLLPLTHLKNTKGDL